jgi:SPP1 gp7 family putative phage head morphogenesis protein
MSSNTFLIDAASRHALLVQRYSNGLELDAGKGIAQTLAKVGDIIEELYSPNITPRRLKALQKQIDLLLEGEYRSIFGELNDELDLFIDSEIEFNQSMLTQAIAPNALVRAPALPSVLNEFKNTLMDVQAGVQITPREALKEYGDAKIKEVNRTVKDGYTEGKTHQELQRSIRQLVPLQARQAGSLVRTLTNTASSTARFEHMFGNLDIFTGYEWVSTLDSHTSLICMGRDGRKYPFAASSPIPPAHWSCRSTIVPVIDDEFNLIGDVKGERPSTGSDGTKEVSGQSTYGGWLKKQGVEFQNEVLGRDRAKLFRNGGLAIDKFANDKGKIYTLKELKRLNPLAFERANLD